MITLQPLLDQRTVLAQEGSEVVGAVLLDLCFSHATRGEPFALTPTQAVLCALRQRERFYMMAKEWHDVLFE